MTLLSCRWCFAEWPPKVEAKPRAPYFVVGLLLKCRVPVDVVGIRMGVRCRVTAHGGLNFFGMHAIGNSSTGKN